MRPACSPREKSRKPAFSMTAWLRIADVPPKFAGATLQVTDEPAKRTVRGEHRREVAVSVGSCGILDRPSTAKAMITSAKPLPVGHGIGSASLKSPMGDAKHMDVRPSLSQRVPARGMTSIIATSPMRITASVAWGSRPGCFSRYVGI